MNKPSDGVRPLTKREREILNLIARYVATVGEPPTVRYVARRLALHHSTVQEHLETLHAKGWLRTASTGGLHCTHPQSEA